MVAGTLQEGSRLQLLSPAPRRESGAAASIPGFQPGDTSANLVFRSNQCGCDVAVASESASLSAWVQIPSLALGVL